MNLSVDEASRLVVKDLVRYSERGWEWQFKVFISSEMVLSTADRLKGEFLWNKLQIIGISKAFKSKVFNQLT